MEQVRKGTVGKTFNFATGTDLTSWDALQVTFVKPDGLTTVVVDDSDGVDDSGTPTDGVITYKDVVGIFDTTGIWKVITELTRGSDVIACAPAGQFQVIDELD